MLATAPQDLGAFYEAEVKPRLTPERVYAGVRWSSTRGRYWRAACPLHGGDNPQAFSVDTETLGWSCFTGSHKGSALDYLNGGEKPRGRAYVEAVTRAAELAGVALGDQVGWRAPARPRRDVARAELRRAFDLAPNVTQEPSSALATRPAPTPPEPTSAQEVDKRLEALRRAQAAFAGSPAAAYCESRGIPAELAARHGAGYVASWRKGGPRVVFPLEAINGHNGYLANVYARALDPSAPPGYARHAYLSGPKGLFNASALVAASEVFVTEAVFDALALIAAGHANTVALGGLELPSAAFGHLRAMTLCLDGDTAGSKGLHRLADAGRQMGLRVNCLPASALGGYKDLSAAWAASVLDLGEVPPPPSAPATPPAPPLEPATAGPAPATAPPPALAPALEQPAGSPKPAEPRQSGPIAPKQAATMPVEAREEATAAYAASPVTAPPPRAALWPPTPRVWEPEVAGLIARLEKSAPPAEPFTLAPGLTVSNPAGAWQAWRRDIATGPEGPRAHSGALQHDLRRLAELELI